MKTTDLGITFLSTYLSNYPFPTLSIPQRVICTNCLRFLNYHSLHLLALLQKLPLPSTLLRSPLASMLLKPIIPVRSSPQLTSQKSLTHTLLPDSHSLPLDGEKEEVFSIKTQNNKTTHCHVKISWRNKNMCYSYFYT